LNIIKIHKNKGINIDIGVRCPLECSACMRQKYRSKGLPIPGKDMTLEQFDKISDFFTNKHISFCGTWSDPIFNPHFIEMLKICKEKNILVDVSNAASQKPKEWFIEAFEANMDAKWIFGIDGMPEQSQIYRKNQDGVKLFDIMLTAKSMGVNTVWQYIVFPYNRKNLNRAKELARQNGIHLLVIKSER